MNLGTVYQPQGGDCVTCGVSSRALRSEVEVLRRRLLDRDVAIVQLEAQMAQDTPHHQYPQGQVAVLRAQCDHWQDKYDRLLEAHKRLQKVNQGLEDKLLRLVDRTESEKSSLAADTASLTTALTTAAQAINRLKQENDRYRNDLNLAIQLLQCNPNKYATHKLDSLPEDLQRKAKSRLSKEPREAPKPEVKVIKVPIPTFPPTAMVYSVNKYAEQNTKEKEEPVDAVSAAIMAAVLEERQRERAKQHCSTCTCGTTHTQPHTDANRNTTNQQQQDSTTEDGFHVSVVDVGTQVLPSYIGETGKVQSTCIYCHHSSRNDRSDRPDRSVKIGSPDSAWDWVTESQDSGSPSTPSSLVSASLSYESETSNATSPQESPGRVSLPLRPTRPLGDVSPRVAMAVTTGRVNGTGRQGVWCSNALSHTLPPAVPTPPPALTPQSNSIPPTSHTLTSQTLSPATQTLNSVPPNAPNQTTHSSNTYPQIPTTENHITSTTQTDIPSPTTQTNEPPTTTVTPHALTNTHSLATMTTTIHHHSKHTHYHHKTTPSRLQSNTRTPPLVYTPPIHRSPPQPSRQRQARQARQADIIASTYTSSGTETTL